MCLQAIKVILEAMGTLRPIMLQTLLTLGMTLIKQVLPLILVPSMELVQRMVLGVPTTCKGRPDVDKYCQFARPFTKVYT